MIVIYILLHQSQQNDQMIQMTYNTSGAMITFQHYHIIIIKPSGSSIKHQDLCFQILIQITPRLDQIQEKSFKWASYSQGKDPLT